MDGNTLPRPNLVGSNLDQKSQLVYASQSNQIKGAAHTNQALPRKIDFERGAKEFKKKKLISSLVKGVAESLVIVAVFASIVTVVGVLVNKQFQGKSLPFTYVGNVAIGGKTQDQIQQILDDKYNEMYITFNEGGLKRQLKLSQLDITMDTASLSEKAIPKKLNPFSFLNWRRLEVPVKINDRFVAGYIERRINSGQSKSEDAQLVMGKNQVNIQPEILGFKSDEKFIIRQIQMALTNAREPVIDVTAVTTKPMVMASDLNDDMTHINSLLQTPVSIKFGYSYIKPTVKQKMAWLSISQKPGQKNIGYDFSKGLIRAYILEQVNRYKPVPKTNPDGTVQPTNRVIVDNIDEVANSVALALKSGSQTTQQLVIRGSSDNFTAVTPEAASTTAVASR